MADSISLLGREIPLYGLMFLLGAMLAAVAALILAKVRKITVFDLACSVVYVMFGSFLGAKLVFIIVTLPKIIELNLSWQSFVFGGFVFYGGLLGGGTALILYTHRYRDETDLFDVYAAVLPLGHALGRVGCFFAGCCYGIPYSGRWAHTYTESAGMTPLGVPLLPIQLIESAGLVLLFAVQMVLFFTIGKNKNGINAVTYLTVYPVMRFIIEFFRGDLERGRAGVFSTSQIISIALVLVTAAVLLYRKRRGSAKNSI